MSRKNRAFALAVATAALVGLSAPVAHAAGPNNTSGFNNDSLVNASGNQLPIQACNNDIPVNAGVLAGQIPLSDISAVLGLLSTNTVSSSVTLPSRRSSALTRAFALAVATAALVALCAMVAGGAGPNDTSGFNNDSLVNASGNQLPVQLCNNDIPVNAGL